MLWVRGNRESGETPGLSHLIVMIIFLQHTSYPSSFFLGEINSEPYSMSQLLPITSATTLPWKLTNCTYSVNFVTDFEILSLSSNSSDWPKTRLFPHSLFSWEEECPSLSCPQPGDVCCLLAAVHTTCTRKLLGKTGKKLSFRFKWADNPTYPGDIISISTTGDTAPNRRFAYRFVWER